MKVVYAVEFPIPAKSASCLQVLHSCEAMAANGHHVELLSLQNAQKFPHQSTIDEVLGRPYALTIHQLDEPRGRGLAPRAALLQLGFIKRLGADLIYTRSWALAVAAALFGRKVVYESHMLLDPRRLKYRLAALVFSRAPALVRLVTTSQTLADDWQLHFGIPAHKLCVAHNGASLPPPPSPRPPQARLQIGYVGQLFPGKGMEMIAQLPALCPWADFHVVGGPDERVDHWKRQLAGVPNVTLHGPVPHAATASFQARMDVLLAPYQSEVGVVGGASQSGRWITPIKLFEYMGSGAAILSSDLPVAREVIRDGINGLLALPDDSAAWVAALQRLAGDPALRRHLADAAYRELAQKYTWEARGRTVLAGLG